MKRIWVALGIALAMIILCGVLLNSAHNVTSEMTTELDRLRQAEEEDYWVQQAVDDLCKKWEGQEDVLTTHVRHSEIEEVTYALTEMKTCWQMGEYELFIMACEEAKVAVDHLWEAARPSLKNIL